VAPGLKPVFKNTSFHGPKGPFFHQISESKLHAKLRGKGHAHGCAGAKEIA